MVRRSDVTMLVLALVLSLAAAWSGMARGRHGAVVMMSSDKAQAPAPWLNTRPEPKTARDRVAFKNKVPFTDDMYETLKKCIELLSKRTRSNPAPEMLTVDEAAWFKTAVESVIADAKLYGPPLRPPPSTKKSE